jgi:restriction system protein
MAEFKHQEIAVGRRKKAIKRFYNIKQSDVLIVPMNRSFAIGIATNEKSFTPGIKNGANQIRVEYLKDSEGQPLRIPRTEVSEAFATRLKVYMAVVNISEFEDEIELLLKQIENDGHVSYSNRIDDQETETIERFKAQLLSNICTGKTNLESGGYGLEKLVLELLRLEGYIGKIPAKNERTGIADVDIDAYTQDRFKIPKLQIQVKHHKGNTSKHGLKQLIAVDDKDTEKWLITSGDLSEEVQTYAEEHSIKAMEGSELVDWIYNKQTQLSSTTPKARHLKRSNAIDLAHC